VVADLKGRGGCGVGWPKSRASRLTVWVGVEVPEGVGDGCAIVVLRGRCRTVDQTRLEKFHKGPKMAFGRSLWLCGNFEIVCGNNRFASVMTTGRFSRVGTVLKVPYHQNSHLTIVFKKPCLVIDCLRPSPYLDNPGRRQAIESIPSDSVFANDSHQFTTPQPQQEHSSATIQLPWRNQSTRLVKQFSITTPIQNLPSLKS
jgi:hypothetical protein